MEKKNNNRYLNVSLREPLYKEFEVFCKDMGMTKTGATENALKMYMEAMKKAVKTIPK